MSFISQVDSRQVKALTRSILNSEWRLSSITRRGGAKRVRWIALFSFLGYPLIGLMLGGFFRHGPQGDVFLTACALVSFYLMLITGTNIFTSFGNGFLSPDEIEILSPFPITSETFFLSRLLVLIIYSTGIGVSIVLGAMIFVGIDTGFALAPLFGLLLMGITASMTTAMLVICIYGLLLTRFDRKKLSRVFGYVQFLGSMLTTFSFILIPRLVENANLRPYTLAAQPSLKWFPPYWFASIAGFISNLSHRADGPFLSLIALLLLVVSSTVAFALLAKSYRFNVENVKQSAHEQAKRLDHRPAASRNFGSQFITRTPEARAVWMLFRAQFRYDTKFRLAIFSMLPITGAYFFLALLNGSILDPFTSNPLQGMKANLLYVSTLLAPVMMLQQLSQSESHKASWIFYSTPIDRVQLLIGGRNIVFTFVLVPYMLLIAIAFSFYMSIAHALLHVLTISAIAVIVAEMNLLLSPRIPFSEQRRPQENKLMTFFWMMLLMLVPMGGLFLIMYFCYPYPLRYTASLALLATLALLLDRFVRSRVSRKLEALEYTG